MKISVITVCFNSSATLRATMESVLLQKGADVEYLVVDGGSNDGTVDLIREYEPRFAGRMRWISERDEGMYDAINKGVAMATGDLIGILNADDRFEDERVLADVVRAFEESDGDLDGVYGDIRFVRGESDKTTRYYSSGFWRPWMHNWGYMPAHPSVYVRKGVFAKYGGYKLGYLISADFEWMTRIFCGSRRGRRLPPIKSRYLKRCMVTMRLGGKSTGGLKAMWILNAENVRANRENGYFCCLPMMAPKYCYKIWGYVFNRKPE